MNIVELAKLIDAEIVSGTIFQSPDIERAFASDLMSDVLTVETDKMMLITGLANSQTIRTAEMSDITCIVFVRGKKVTQEMQHLANELGITLLECRSSMFKTAGILYNAGVKAVY